MIDGLNPRGPWGATDRWRARGERLRAALETTPDGTRLLLADVPADRIERAFLIARALLWVCDNATYGRARDLCGVAAASVGKNWRSLYRLGRRFDDYGLVGLVPYLPSRVRR